MHVLPSEVPSTPKDSISDQNLQKTFDAEN